MRRSFLLSIAVVLTVALVVQAQPPQRGQRGQRGGQPGGPRGGGMFMGRGGGMGAVQLLGIESVRKELDLLEPQIEDLEKVTQSLRGNRPDFARFREMSQEERQKAMEKMRADMEKRMKEAEAKVKEILLPEQWDRLQEIRIQLMGVRALMDKDVQQKLKLSADQVAKLQKVSEESRQSMMEQMRSLFQAGDRDAIREKMQAMQKEQESKLLAVLTDQQRKDFEKLKGKPANIEMPRFGGFGGGRRPGAGRPGGGRPGGQGRRPGSGRPGGGNGNN